MGRRAFIIVMDACGIGALPDAADYGDGGADTLGHLARAVGGLKLPTLGALGLGSIVSLPGVPPAVAPVLHGRLHALGAGKDSTAGHRELVGIVASSPPPSYPAGLPEVLRARVEACIGSAVICNRAFNGVAAIEAFGEEHVASGRPILYTSADSVIQIAAHVDVIAPQDLYRICETLRAELSGPDDVGRVIARPFDGAAGAFERTDGRRDYARAPSGPSYLQACQDIEVPVHGVGKVAELFGGVGFDESHPGATNAVALASVERLAASLPSGLVFANLIDTDQRFGHRKDRDGFHHALIEIDSAISRLLGVLRDEDLLIITADHGCDADAPHSDHTREYVPLLASMTGHGGARHDGPLADVGASAVAWLGGGVATALPGTSFLNA